MQDRFPWGRGAKKLSGPCGAKTELILYVCSHRAFLKIGSLEFSDFLHDDVTSSNLKSDEARFFEKNLIRLFLAIMADFWPKFAQK